jgi:hypothetical protein
MRTTLFEASNHGTIKSMYPELRKTMLMAIQNSILNSVWNVAFENSLKSTPNDRNVAFEAAFEATQNYVWDAAFAIAFKAECDMQALSSKK